jgi:hypothetical protein
MEGAILCRERGREEACSKGGYLIVSTLGLYPSLRGKKEGGGGGGGKRGEKCMSFLHKYFNILTTLVIVVHVVSLLFSIVIRNRDTHTHIHARL